MIHWGGVSFAISVPQGGGYQRWPPPTFLYGYDRDLQSCYFLLQLTGGLAMHTKDEKVLRLPEGKEPTPENLFKHARDVIKGRWPEAESTIMEDPYWAYCYARDVIKGRWPEAEPTIMQNPQKAYWYAKDVIKDRWPEAEPIIMEDGFIANGYARLVIKDRWPEAEPAIKEKNFFLWRNYYEDFGVYFDTYE